MARRSPDYHINWSTKNRIPMISAEVEGVIHSSIVNKAAQLGGYVHAIGGMPDHVHLVVRIPVSIPVSEFVGEIKGYSSRSANRLRSMQENGGFEWQDDYDVEGLHSSILQRVIKYVQNQKEHHRDTRWRP